MVAKEFDEALRSIVQMDYGLILISHATDRTFTDENGVEYNRIVPTLSSRPRNIVSRMADIIGYSRAVKDTEGHESTRLFMRGTTRYEAGSRFKYTPDSIDFNYKSLVSAIGDAIDKQMEEDGEEYFTNERTNSYVVEELDFDELMGECKSIINSLIESKSEEEFETKWKPEIDRITNKHLGKGVKISSIEKEQTQVLDLIVSDLKDLVK